MRGSGCGTSAVFEGILTDCGVAAHFPPLMVGSVDVVRPDRFDSDMVVDGSTSLSAAFMMQDYKDHCGEVRSMAAA